jgi:Ca2+-binding EF-hand superfamily protein
MLLSQMEPTHAEVFVQAAAQHSEAPDDAPHGVLCLDSAVELVNRMTGAMNQVKQSLAQVVNRVIELVAGEGTEVLEEDELLVVLKLLGQHTEPEHVGYLMGQAPRAALGSMAVRHLQPLLGKCNVRIAVPLQTLEKLKDAFNEADTDGDGSINVLELQEMTHQLGLQWTSKDVMRVVGADEAQPKGVIRVDFVAFIDAICEAYGDPFYELRYAELFRLMDADGGGSLTDDEVIPLLMASGLTAEAARAANVRLMGGNLLLDFNQFATGMFEEEIIGEAFPRALLNFTRAFSNFDLTSELPAPITPSSMTILFRKMGARFSEEERDYLFGAMDYNKVGRVNFSDFCFSFTRVDPAKLGDLANYFMCASVPALRTCFSLNRSR